MVNAYKEKEKHIVTIQTEHHAVLDNLEYIEIQGYEVTYLPILADDLLDMDVFKKSLRPDTILVSLMYADN